MLTNIKRMINFVNLHSADEHLLLRPQLWPKCSVV